MPGLFETIPGYAEAVKREQQARQESFLALPSIIGGIWLEPITLRRLVWLELAGVFRTADLTLGHVELACWLLNPRHTHRPSLRRSINRLCNTLRVCWCFRRDPDGLIKGLLEHFNSTFSDAPGGSSVDNVNPTCYVANIAHRITSAYGWSLREVLDTPLTTLWQMLREIRLSDDPKAAFISESDKVRGEWLREINAKRKANCPTNSTKPRGAQMGR